MRLTEWPVDNCWKLLKNIFLQLKHRTYLHNTEEYKQRYEDDREQRETVYNDDKRSKQWRQTGDEALGELWDVRVADVDVFGKPIKHINITFKNYMLQCQWFRKTCHKREHIYFN